MHESFPETSPALEETAPPIEHIGSDGRALCSIFFPEELTRFLDDAGFALQRPGAFPEFERDADSTTWNAACVARGV